MTKKIRADMILLTITIVWGASFPLMKMVLEYIPAFAYLSVRFFIASAVLALLFHKNFRNMKKRTLLYGSIIGLFMFGGMAFQVMGLYTTSASNSGFITGLNVVMVPLISSVLLKKKPDRASTIGVSVAFAGLFFLSGGLKFDFNIGDFLTFLCAICWALQIIAIDKFTQTEDAPLLAFVQMLFIAVTSTFFWLLADAGKAVEINRTSIGILLFTGIVGSALAFGGQTIAQKDTTPTHTALILTAEPVFAAIFAMIIPNAQGVTEKPTLTTIIGGAMILAGMLISELKIGSGQKQSAEQGIPEK